MHRKLCECVWRHFSPIYESRSNFEDVKKWVMGPSWCPTPFFCRSLIRAHTGIFGDVPKFCDLLVEVGHMTKQWVLSCNELFGSNFLGSLIRTCTGSFANVCEGTSPLYMKVGQILRLSKNGSWVLVDACLFFCGSLIRADTGSFKNVWKHFGLLVEVGHMTKWWVLSCNELFESNFLRSLIRTHRGSFANVFEGTSPLYMKVGEILRLSENGSWALVDAQHIFCGSLIRAETGSFQNVRKHFGLLVEVGHMTKQWVLSCNELFGSNFLGSLIRTCTGSFANVFEGMSTLYMKVGQISRLSKNGSWALVDVRPLFFVGH